MQKKIVYCTPSLYIPGGVERVLTTKANYLADVAGYDIYIVLTDGKGKGPYYHLSPKVKIIQLDINFEELWHLSFLKKILVYLQKQRIYKKRLTSTLLSLKPDITVSLLRREINFLTSIKDGSKKVGEIHVNRDHYRNFEKGGFIKNLFASWWQKQLLNQLNRLDKFIVLTEDDCKSWKELEKKEVIPNPLAFFPEKSSSLNNKQIISVGRFSYEKGFDSLIKVWELVAKKHPEWILKIYGSGNEENLTPLILQANMGKTIIPQKPTSQIYEAYQESSIYICSSRFEGFGMTLIEAMSCGVPCISFDCPNGPAELITHGEDGLLVPLGDIEKLAESIEWMITHEEERLRMSNNARLKAKQYTAETIMPQWVELFEKVAKQ